MKSGLALVVLGLVALPLPAAVAQERTATPSAEELWQSYPLDARSAPTVSPRRAAAPASATPAPAGATGGGTPVTPLALLGVLVALGVLAYPGLRRRTQGGREAPPPGTPSPYERVRALAPPDPHRAWTAAIEWHEAGGEASFRVLARRSQAGPGSVLAESPPLAWPPADGAAVQALTGAVQRLEGVLLASGWSALDPGDEWYSKRFAWEPAGSRRQDRHRGRAAAHVR